MAKNLTSRPGENGNWLNDTLNLKKVFLALRSLPRVLHLVWAASPPRTMGTAFFTIIAGIIPLANAIVARYLLDSVIQGFLHHSFTLIYLPVFFQFLLILVRHTCTTFSTLYQTLLQERVAEYTQSLILEKANTLDLDFFENSEFYDELRNASQEATNKPVLMIQQTFDLVRSLITLISMLGLLIHLAWWLVIVAIVAPIPSFIANSKYSLRGYWMMRGQSPEKREQAYIVQLLTFDLYNKEIKLFNLGKFFLRHYEELSEKFYQQNKSLQVPRNITNLLWTFLSILANSVTYLYIAFQAVAGYISIGSLSQYTMAASQVGISIEAVLDGVDQLYENNLFVNTVFNFLSYQPKIVSPPNPQPITLPPGKKGLDIEFRHVSFTYSEEQQPALSDVSFTIGAGETIALVGLNGAGKTTLVKLLTRLYDPQEGEILVGGINIKEYDLTDLRNHIGVIFQDYVKYALKARENIGVGQIDNVEDLHLIQLAAIKSGAAEFIDHLSDTYETMLGKWFKGGTQISGGQWQKIALARAFMREAGVLILDEPTSALDPQAEYDIFTRFQLLTESKTTIFITHRFSTARQADRIFVIENGKVIEMGTHNELITLGGGYAKLFNLQAKAYL